MNFGDESNYLPKSRFLIGCTAHFRLRFHMLKMGNYYIFSNDLPEKDNLVLARFVSASSIDIRSCVVFVPS